jgi:crotonobetainyl-CoA:carnitine CoA-transferase CaiB-like acyl-CoA transferase
VIKVEPPGGDPARRWGPPFAAGQSPLFLCANRGKRSVELDLRSERGLEAALRLASRSHVFVQAYRAGVADRLGLGYDAVRAVRPNVVYVSVTAFGTEGPMRDQPGYDPLMQAQAGLMSVTGDPDGPPARVGTSLVDMGTGLWTALAVLAEMMERGWPDPDPDAGAVHLTSSLLDTAVAWMAYHLQGHLATGAVPGPMGTGLGMIEPYRAFPARDGHIMIAAGNDAIFGRLCDALDLDGLSADPRFATNAERVVNRDDLVAALEARTRDAAAADLLDRLRAARVPCAPIQDTAEVAADPQVAASGMLRPTDAGDGGYVDVAPPLRWDGARPAPGTPAPAAGQHTAEVLAEIGMAGETPGSD